MVFMQPQRLLVPLFQRPYVWNEENQWEPLWNDVARVADRLLAGQRTRTQPHFLGAVVLQQTASATGLMQERTIIDGQQRLTTLQLLLDALHAELLAADATAPALRVEPLIVNAEPFCKRPEDRFKVWPTNRDRPAFNAVMSAPSPVAHDELGLNGDRMLEAHRYFSLQARAWLALNGPEDIQGRAAAIETATRDLLQLVVIDLGADENAQEIFETLNARGAQLTAADLIKNFVFQRLLESGADVEDAYERHWREFESAFWETEVSVGRLRYSRSSIFLNHWLVARTGEEVVAREVFTRFKSYADFEAEVPMLQLLEQLGRAAAIYKSFALGAGQSTGPIDHLSLFGYRTGVLESEVVKPLVLCLLDPEKEPIPPAQVSKALSTIESWLVRRMLVRATTKSYTQAIAEIITQLRKGERAAAGDLIEAYFIGQKSGSRYWPDDREVRDELEELQAYRRLSRGRMRMVLEAVEDDLRGWRQGRTGLGGERVTRSRLHIEHVMPRKWAAHWPLPEGAIGDENRDRLIHTIGNLTLLTGPLNSKVSNGPWSGGDGKRHALEAHDVLLLNREILKAAPTEWDETEIRSRTGSLTSRILEIWPVPSGYTSGFRSEQPRIRHRLDLADLISADRLQPSMALIPRRRQFSDVVATLLPTGELDVGGTIYPTPSAAAEAVVGHKINGWWFFLVDKSARRSLRDVRRDYVDSLSEDVESDDEDDDEDDS